MAHFATGTQMTITPSLQLPEPVFSASLELESAAYEKDLKEALEFLQREDPSAIVTYDEETGQTLVIIWSVRWDRPLLTVVL